MIQPIRKSVMSDYRYSMGTADCPQFLDTEQPITPVAVVNQGLPIPKASQEVKTIFYSKTSTAQVQVSTVSSNQRVWLLGWELTSNGTTSASDIWLFDATSGTPTVADGSLLIKGRILSGVSVEKRHMYPLPIEFKSGLRIDINCAGATPENRLIIYYCEESLI